MQLGLRFATAKLPGLRTGRGGRNLVEPSGALVARRADSRIHGEKEEDTMSTGGEKYPYDVISTFAGIEDLNERVSERLRKGWRLVGGVATTSVTFADGEIKVAFSQAMVRGDYNL